MAADALAAVTLGYVRAITLQYNMLYRDLEEGISHAHEKGIAVVVMGPVGGGALDEPAGVFRTIVPESKSVPALAIGFVLANPHVSLTLSGMSTLEQVEENMKALDVVPQLTDDVMEKIEEVLDNKPEPMEFQL